MGNEQIGSHLDEDQAGAAAEPTNMFFKKNVTESLLHDGDYLNERKKRDQPKYQKR